MSAFLLLLIVAAGVFFGYPLLNEDTGSECDALERATVRLAIASPDRKAQPLEQSLGQFVQGMSKGQFAGAVARDKYPNVPVGAACALLYWRATIEPPQKSRLNQPPPLRP